ncbi:unnamed protein product [Pylaiella littoralis]
MPEGYFSSDARDCFFFDDTVLMAVVLFLGFGPCLVLCRRLLRVQDYFKIREELIGLLSEEIGLSNFLFR